MPATRRGGSEALARVVGRCEAKSHHAEEVRGLASAERLLLLPCEVRERDDRLATQGVEIQLRERARMWAGEPKVPERLAVLDVVVETQQGSRRVKREELVGLPEICAGGRRLEAHVVTRDRRLPAPDVECEAAVRQSPR
jgi:hypothetical protein